MGPGRKEDQPFTYSVSGRRANRCKGPGVESRLHSRKSKEASKARRE